MARYAVVLSGLVGCGRIGEVWTGIMRLVEIRCDAAGEVWTVRVGFVTARNGRLGLSRRGIFRFGLEWVRFGGQGELCLGGFRR